MKWIPFCVLACVCAFGEVNFYRITAATIFCVIAFFYALHFDDQIMKFLSWHGSYIEQEKKRREKEGK